MIATLTIPDEIPAMTLPGTVLLPQTALPLRIFEPRYLEMLSDALAGNRMFAVANRKVGAQPEGDEASELHEVAGVGIIRMCAKRADGTSMVMLLGAARARIRRVLCGAPYPILEIESLPSQNLPVGFEREICLRRLFERVDRINALIQPHCSQSDRCSDKTQDPEPLLHFVMQNYCLDPAVKQEILQTVDYRVRSKIAERYLDHQIATLELGQELGGASDAFGS